MYWARLIKALPGGRVFVEGKINPNASDSYRENELIWIRLFKEVLFNRNSLGYWNATKSNTKIFQKHWSTQLSKWKFSWISFSCENCPFSTCIEFAFGLSKFKKYFVLHSERTISRITHFSLATNQVLLVQTNELMLKPCTLALTWKTIVDILFFLLLSI